MRTGEPGPEHRGTYRLVACLRRQDPRRALAGLRSRSTAALPIDGHDSHGLLFCMPRRVVVIDVIDIDGIAFSSRQAGASAPPVNLPLASDASEAMTLPRSTTVPVQACPPSGPGGAGRSLEQRRRGAAGQARSRAAGQAPGPLICPAGLTAVLLPSRGDAPAGSGSPHR